MVTNTIAKSGDIVDDWNYIQQTLFAWKLLPYGGEFDEVGYCKNLLDAQKLIDAYENYKKELNGDFIVKEIEYKPKQR